MLPFNNIGACSSNETKVHGRHGKGMDGLGIWKCIVSQIKVFIVSIGHRRNWNEVVQIGVAECLTCAYGWTLPDYYDMVCLHRSWFVARRDRPISDKPCKCLSIPTRIWSQPPPTQAQAQVVEWHEWMCFGRNWSLWLRLTDGEVRRVELRWKRSTRTKSDGPDSLAGSIFAPPQCSLLHRLTYSSTDQIDASHNPDHIPPLSHRCFE